MSAGSLVDTYVAVQQNGQVRDADGLDDGQDHGALDMFAGTVFAVRVVGPDMEVGDMAGARSEREDVEALQELFAGRVVGRGGRWCLGLGGWRRSCRSGGGGGGTDAVGGVREGAHLCV